MSVSVNIPDDLYRQAREIATAQHLSVEEVISSAFAGQLAARERLKQKAAKGRRDSFVKFLNNVPDIEPEAFDRI